jgi:hypothetical protein
LREYASSGVKMFEVSSVSQTEIGMETAPSLKASAIDKKPKSKSKSKSVSVGKPDIKVDGFSELINLVSRWSPLDTKASRDLLVNELRIRLEEERHACMTACIPALVVDGVYPIEIMNYNEENDIDEFVSRMLWIHRVFRSSIGFVIGVPDDETAIKIEDICKSLLCMDQDCVVQLL